MIDNNSNNNNNDHDNTVHVVDDAHADECYVNENEVDDTFFLVAYSQGIPGEFSGNSWGTGRFLQFPQERVPQSRINISWLGLPTICQELSVGSSLFEILVPCGERERKKESLEKSFLVA